MEISTEKPSSMLSEDRQKSSDKSSSSKKDRHKSSTTPQSIKSESEQSVSEIAKPRHKKAEKKKARRKPEKTQKKKIIESDRDESESEESESTTIEEKRKAKKSTKPRKKSGKTTSECIHCQNICNFHFKQIHGGVTSHARDNVTPSRHYLFDPTADMLYNPWLGQKVAWPEQKSPDKGKRKLSSQFMSQHVNRKFLNFVEVFMSVLGSRHTRHFHTQYCHKKIF